MGTTLLPSPGFRARAALLAAGIGLLPQLAAAQSGCTATYISQRTSATSGQNLIRFTPTGTTSGIQLSVGTGAAANGTIGAAALSPVDGLLYYFKISNPASNTAVSQLYTWNPVTRANTLIGTVPGFDPDSATAGDQVEGVPAGATFDTTGNLWVLYSGPGTSNNGPAYIVQLNAGTAQVVANTQKRLLDAGGDGPGTNGTVGDRDVGALGDLVVNPAGQMVLYSNNRSDEPAIYTVNTATGQLANANNPAQICSGLVDYFDGGAIMPNGNRYGTTTYDTSSGRCIAGGGTAGGTFTQIGVDTTWLTDMAGCANPVSPPTLGKGFSPSGIGPGGVSTLTINVGNPNVGPVILVANLVDTLPANITRSGTGNLGGSCFSAPVNPAPNAPVGNTITSTANSVTLASGSIVPGGGCTITMQVTGAIPGTYTNTIPANALQTSTGNNASAASAQLVIGTLPTLQIAKTTVGASGSHDFSFTGTNNAAGTPTTISVTGNATQTSTVRTLAASALTGNTTLTETALPAGFALTAINCTGLGTGGAQTVDLPGRTVTLDNLATAIGSNILCTFTNRAVQTDLSIIKTDNTGTATAGATTTYTIAVANNGPEAADGAVVRDDWTASPATGLNCSAGPLACAASGTAGTQCPPGVTPAQLQSGVMIPALPGGGSVTFTLTCQVIATP